jgi:multiple sugar transport system ATP-binding protein
MEIYSRPATRFVATFVGSPTMNFVPVRVAGGGAGGVTVTLGDGTSVKTAVPAMKLEPGEFTLGIRAEGVRVAPNGQGVTTGTVDVLERLGDRTLVYTKLKDGSVVVAEDIGYSRVAVNDTVSLSIDGSRVHLFDTSDRAWHCEEGING